MKSTKPQKVGVTIRFNTKLSEGILTFPKNASLKLPTQSKTMIEGTINNLPFRAPVNQDNRGSHYVRVNKAMKKDLGIIDSNKVSTEITRVGVESETRVPADLNKALKTTSKSLVSWLDITPMARRDWIFSICTSKQSETRKRRIEKARDMLASGKRRLCCFPGIKWMMKKNAKTCGMWLPLTK